MTDDDRDDAPQGFAEHLLVYVHEPTLWPVLAVVVLIAGTLGAAVLSMALERRNLFALAALAILIVASGHALFGDLRARRFGVASAIVLALWLASAGVALALRSAGVF